MPELFEPAFSDQWQYLATTNRNLENVAIDEVAALVDADATAQYPGMIRFTGDERGLHRLHRCARSLHRVLLALGRTRCEDLDDVVALAAAVDVETYLGPEQSFAVRARRHGDHPFTSPDVEREVGQAIVDAYRTREATRPPVDLEAPDVLFRVLIRGDTAVLTIDATGQRSLHRRWYRRHEHAAALRPTVAYAMLQYAGYDGDARLVDPLCGCGTIPVEAGLLADGRSPTAGRDRPHRRLRFLDPDVAAAASASERPSRTGDPGVCSGDRPPTETLAVVGADIDAGAVADACENARAAGLEDAVAFARADARALAVDGEVLVSDLPFGIRTDDAIEPLYAEFFEDVARGDWERVVVLTAREDLVTPEPARSIPVRRGRLDASILVFE